VVLEFPLVDRSFPVRSQTDAHATSRFAGARLDSGSATELPFDPPLPPAVASALTEHDSAMVHVGDAVDGLAMSTYNPETGRAHLMYVSESLASMLGWTPTALLGRSPEVLIAPSTPAAQLSAVAAIVEGGQQAIVDLDLRHADGSHVPVQASFLLVPSLPGQAPHFLALYRSLGDRRRSTPSLVDPSDMLDSLAYGRDLDDVVHHVRDRVMHQIPGTDVWMVLVDRDGAIEPVAIGRTSHDLVTETARVFTESSRTLTSIVDEVDHRRAEDLAEPLRSSLEAAQVHAVWAHPLRGSDGSIRGVLFVAHPDRATPHPAEHLMLRQLGRVLTVAVDRSRAEATLAHQALHDPLTQLPNRALILDRLEQAVARLGRDNTRLAVLLVDLDRFKQLNAARGPETGDAVLIEVARRLRRSVRMGDTVGRIGGDQFLVLCVAMNGEADASAMARRAVAGVAEPFVMPSGEPVLLSASVGVVLVDRTGASPASIISSAESALARATEQGRGRFAIFEEGWQRNVVIRHEVEKALSVAISSDELVLHYQPIVETSTGVMIGAEALIRWDRPGFGLLPPAEFIEIAEETGLIVPVGEWIIDQVCSVLAGWPIVLDRPPPQISVNLSARQLAEAPLVATVLSAIERHGIQPEQLAFEVTESMRVEDLETARSSLHRLASLGCKISIDDFGIGYATLDYLRRFSMANTIKIDRSFVDGLGEHREDTAIVTASIALAASLGLDVVAEGVETAVQNQKLTELNCKYSQGFGFSPPVPLEKIHELWLRGRLIILD
jgi:diguanylate cyclase (GGDEF)-like protein